jgi:hypothetical protein
MIPTRRGLGVSEYGVSQTALNADTITLLSVSSAIHFLRVAAGEPHRAIGQFLALDRGRQIVVEKGDQLFVAFGLVHDLSPLFSKPARRVTSADVKA